MHQPRPHGRFGPELNGEDAAAAELLMRRLTNIKALAGIDSLKMTRALPGGGSATALDMGGVVKLIVQPAPVFEEPQLVSDGLAKAFVPMLFSGAITASRVRPGEGVGMLLTEQTRRRLAGYSAQRLPAVARAQRLQRFVIEYGPRFSEFVPADPGLFTHTQYVQLRPTWYSGAMAQVVQIVGGYGRMELRELPDTPIERARLALPAAVEQAVERELGNVRLPGYTGFPPASGAIQFDYKFHECHGVGFDSNRRPWLLRINGQGVYAMPLPLVPATTTKAFRRWVEEVTQDEEILWSLDRFGGLPSGESFPAAGQDFEAWRRAGVVIKVCDTADFYSHIAYSTACGWSLNASGTEGYNTCYDYDEAQGLAQGLTYKLELRLAPAQDDGRLPGDLQLEPEEQALLNTYLAGLYRRAGSSARDRAVKYKLRRVTAAELLARARAVAQAVKPDFEAEYDFWDGRTLEPIAAHGGAVARVGEGWLYHPAKFQAQPQLKFPEPTMGVCLSFDFTPLAAGRDKNPRCDTIMFAYFLGDELKTVKYFRDARTHGRPIEDDYQDCMIVGSWQRTEYLGQSGIVGPFYTSDVDERETVAQTERVTTIVGKDKGYDHTPAFAFDAPFWRPGTLTRSRYFTHETTVVTSEARSRNMGLCVPYLCRNAVLYARQQSVAGRIASKSLARYAIQDPYSYRFWTYDFVMHWAGSLPVMRGVPYPKNGNPVWVEMEDYSPGPCSDSADSGPWIPSLPTDYAWLIHPNANEWKLQGGGGAPPVQEYSRESAEPSSLDEVLQASILPQLGIQPVHRKPDSMYFLSSPTPEGLTFTREGARIEAGKATYANVSEPDPEAPEQRKRFGYTTLADHKSSHHFIGVINE